MVVHWNDSKSLRYTNRILIDSIFLLLTTSNYMNMCNMITKWNKYLNSTLVHIIRLLFQINT